MTFSELVVVGSFWCCVAGLLFTLLMPEFSVFISKAVGVSILANITVWFLFGKNDDRQDWR